MYSICITRHTQQSRDRIESDAEYSCSIGSASKLCDFVTIWDTEYPYYRTLIASGREQSADCIESYTGKGSFMGLYDVGDGQRKGVEKDNIARGLL